MQFEREKAIKLLTEIDLVIANNLGLPGLEPQLRSMLQHGFKGYENCLDEELSQYCATRGLYEGSLPTPHYDGVTDTPYYTTPHYDGVVNPTEQRVKSILDSADYFKVIRPISTLISVDGDVLPAGTYLILDRQYQWDDDYQVVQLKALPLTPRKPNYVGRDVYEDMTVAVLTFEQVIPNENIDFFEGTLIAQN